MAGNYFRGYYIGIGDVPTDAELMRHKKWFRAGVAPVPPFSGQYLGFIPWHLTVEGNYIYVCGQQAYTVGGIDFYDATVMKVDRTTLAIIDGFSPRQATNNLSNYFQRVYIDGNDIYLVGTAYIDSLKKAVVTKRDKNNLSTEYWTNYYPLGAGYSLAQAVSCVSDALYLYVTANYNDAPGHSAPYRWKLNKSDGSTVWVGGSGTAVTTYDGIIDTGSYVVLAGSAGGDRVIERVDKATNLSVIHSISRDRYANMGIVYGGLISIPQGPNNGNTFINDSAYGSVNWLNPGNAQASDDVYATAGGGSTKYLKATGFGFSIPTGATIVGVAVDVERHAGGPSHYAYTQLAKLVKAGVVIGTSQDEGSNWPTTDTYATYGGSFNLWGTTWTPDEINAAGFGFAISAYVNSGDTAYIDHIRITVYYTMGSAPAVYYVCGNSYQSIITPPYGDPRVSVLEYGADFVKVWEWTKNYIVDTNLQEVLLNSVIDASGIYSIGSIQYEPTPLVYYNQAILTKIGLDGSHLWDLQHETQYMTAIRAIGLDIATVPTTLVVGVCDNNPALPVSQRYSYLEKRSIATGLIFI